MLTPETTNCSSVSAEFPVARRGGYPGGGSPRDGTAPGEVEPAPLWLGDWTGVVFIHFRVEASTIQPLVPFLLDTFEDAAYVSLVAFTMERFRPALGGRGAAALFWPVRWHHFLNVRTYVRHGDQRGIYFLTEWVSKVLCVPVARLFFDLPYRYGRIRYQNSLSPGILSGSVRALGKQLNYEASVTLGATFGPCEAGTLDDFLLERYVAFTAGASSRRFFRVRHQPWPQTRATIRLGRSDLLPATGWPSSGRLEGAHYSPGVRNVVMSRSQLV